MIALNPHFRDALAAKNLDQFPGAQKYGFSKQDAVLRTQLVLAITLVHEVCHALHMAATNDQDEPEPFYRDHRLAEVGYAIESALLNGTIEPIGDYAKFPELLAAPYGLTICRWPGPGRGVNMRNELVRCASSAQASPKALHVDESSI